MIQQVVKLNREEDQLKVSSTNIQFGSSQQIVRSLILKNTHTTDALIYKIKTNNLQAIEATPNIGLIKANSAMSLRIKATPAPFDAKLLINYANAGERPGEFNQVWTSLDKKLIRSKHIRVFRMDEKDKQNAEQAEIRRNYQLSGNNYVRSHSMEKNKTNYRSKQSVQVNQSELANNTFELQQKLNQQQSVNAKIKQQLQITQQKLKMINQERLQIKVNKSIGIICEDYHTSFTTLLLYGLAIFVFGYIIAKWDK